MSLLATAALAFGAGLVGAVLVDWRGWLRLAKDFRRHGFDNHFCDEPGCCEPVRDFPQC